MVSDKSITEEGKEYIFSLSKMYFFICIKRKQKPEKQIYTCIKNLYCIAILLFKYFLCFHYKDCNISICDFGIYTKCQ